MGLRTITLKLHKPGKNKRKVLDDAILNYNKAYRHLLERAHGELGEIREIGTDENGAFSSYALSRWMGGKFGQELDQYNVQPFKDSLKLELGTALESYFKLEASGRQVGFPKVQGLEDGDRNRDSGDEGHDGPCCADFDRLRPVYFCRYDTKRSYSLLYDREKDRYFAKLYLMNAANAKEVSSNGPGGRLEYIHRKAEPFEFNRKKATFIIVPLSFGKRQEQILKTARDKPETLRTARLSKKKGSYYLSVSIDTGEIELKKPVTFLGVARGLKNRLNYAVAGPRGELLEEGAVLYRQYGSAKKRVVLNELHEAANSIVRLALGHNSQVIVENLADRSDRLSWRDSGGNVYRPQYGPFSYNRMVKLLEYKLQEKGLPAPVRVSSAGIFYTCPKCGRNSRQNRLDRDMFICTDCGTATSVESLGSINLSGKLLNYKKSTIKIKVRRTPEGAWFINDMLGLKLFVSHGRRQREVLLEELMRIASGFLEEGKVLSRRNFGKKAGIIKKICSAENLSDIIEFV